MPSHSLAQLNIDELDILGYSVSGEETVVAMPQLDVCFDIGKAPDQVIPINHILLSHGHMDHAAGIAYYLSHRLFAGQSEGTVLAPEGNIGPMRDILNAWGRLDGNAIKAKLVGVKPGEEYDIKPNLFARVFPTNHCRGSVGYCVLERRKKLKEEYHGLSGPQIVELKKQGIEIDHKIEIPIVSYFGDTKYAPFHELEYVRKSKILITECTFFADEHTTNADAGNHMHIDEFGGLMEKMENEHIIVIHLTKRTPAREMREMFREKLSPDIFKRITLLMEQKRRY